MTGQDTGKYVLGRTFTYGPRTRHVFNTAGKIREFVLSIRSISRSSHFFSPSLRRLMKQRPGSLSWSEVHTELLQDELPVLGDDLVVLLGQRNRNATLLLLFSRHPSLPKIPPTQLKKTTPTVADPASFLLGNKKILRGSSPVNCRHSSPQEMTINEPQHSESGRWATP